LRDRRERGQLIEPIPKPTTNNQTNGPIYPDKEEIGRKREKEGEEKKNYIFSPLNHVLIKVIQHLK
jgi:hypothetical protein